MSKDAGPTGTRTHWMSWVVGLVDIGKREVGQGWRMGEMRWEEANAARLGWGPGNRRAGAVPFRACRTSSLRVSRG